MKDKKMPKNRTLTVKGNKYYWNDKFKRWEGLRDNKYPKYCKKSRVWLM